MKRWILSKKIGKPYGDDRGHVFVYGTLKMGGYFSSLFDKERLWVQPATIKGTLYDIGPAPGLSLEGSNLVHGELHLYKDFSYVIRQMDRIEGFIHEGSKFNLYDRQVIEVDTPLGRHTAVVYTIRQSLTIHKRVKKIENGIWPIYR